MKIFYVCLLIAFLIGAALVNTTALGRRVWMWMMHGPIKRSVMYKAGTGREYSDGYLEYVTREGYIVNLTRELYDTPREWHICISKYGENGTTAKVSNRTYWEMIDDVNAGEGKLTFVDIFTGLVHIRISAT